MKRMWISKLYKILPILLLPVILSGCWEREELNEQSFVLGVGLDKDGSEYKVTTQIVNPSEVASMANSGGDGAPVTVFEYRAETIYEAFRKYFSLKSPRSSYYGHLRVLVIGEKLAREGISQVMDVILRSRELRSDFYIMVARDEEAANVLHILTPLNKLPASGLFYSLTNSSSDSALTNDVTIDRLINDLVSEGRNPALPGVKIIGDSTEGASKQNLTRSVPKTSLKFEGIAVFKKDKMVGWLNEDESEGYNYIIDEVDRSIGVVDGDNGKPIVIATLRSSTKRKVKMIDGQPHIDIHVRAIANVEDVQSRDPLDTPEVISELEEKWEEHLVQVMKKASDRTIQQYNSDIMGYGELIYRSYPKVWEKLKERQDTYLKNLPVHYKASVNINRIGIIDRSIMPDLKE